MLCGNPFATTSVGMAELEQITQQTSLTHIRVIISNHDTLYIPKYVCQRYGKNNLLSAIVHMKKLSPSGVYCLIRIVW